MEKCRIVEQGNHDELIARGGAYAALYHAQFTGPTVTAPGAEVAPVGMGTHGMPRRHGSGGHS